MDLTQSISFEQDDLKEVCNLRCNTCRKIEDVVPESVALSTTKNGRHLMKARCTVCHSNLNIIITTEKFSKLSKSLAPEN